MSLPGKIAAKVILGASNIGDSKADAMVRFDDSDDVSRFLNVFSKHGYDQIDTSRMYSPHARTTSEPRLGAVSAGSRFYIDTKVLSVQPGDHTKEKILQEIDSSLQALKIDKINVEYLHVPDRQTPFEEACEAMNIAQRQGKIDRWGISNYTAQEVERFLEICEKFGYNKPSVYQGQYNAIVRGAEKQLFPILRKHGIAFYAFSPAAAGLFAGSHKKTGKGGHFDQSLAVGSTYSGLYLKPSITAAAEKASDLCSKHGIGGHAASLRWTAHHSILDGGYGDSVIVGASSLEQLEANLAAIEEGPLPDDLSSALRAIYQEISSDEEVLYHL